MPTPAIYFSNCCSFLIVRRVRAVRTAWTRRLSVVEMVCQRHPNRARPPPRVASHVPTQTQPRRPTPNPTTNPKTNCWPSSSPSTDFGNARGFTKTCTPTEVTTLTGERATQTLPTPFRPPSQPRDDATRRHRWISRMVQCVTYAFVQEMRVTPDWVPALRVP